MIQVLFVRFSKYLISSNVPMKTICSKFTTLPPVPPLKKKNEEKNEDRTTSEVHSWQMYLFFCAADTVRRNLGLSTDFCRKEPYDKLEKALLSGLPNEVDFAINVCTLLSNEGKHSLNVTKSPKLIEILLAHVGIFRDGAGSLFTLQSWRLEASH